MKLSVVTPSFGQAQFLESAINSVIKAERAPDEYFVIDGGSEDGSVDVIRRFAGQLSGWVSESDHGQADAINKGFARSTGDVLSWLNSDDQIKPEAYRLVMNAFENDPDLVMVYGDVESIDAQGAVFNRQTFRQYTLNDLACFNIISQPAVFFRRSAWLQAGPLEVSYQFLLDHHLWLRLAPQGKILYLPRVLAQARYHSDAKNVARAAEFGEEAFKIVEWLRTQPAYRELIQQNENGILAGAQTINAFYLVEAGRFKPGLAAVMQAARYDVKSIQRNYKRALLAVLGILGLDGLKTVYTRVRKNTFHG